MAEIPLPVLAEERNRWIWAARAEPARAAVQRVQAQGGTPAWHLVIAWGDGTLRAIRVQNLLRQLLPDRPGQRMEECDLPVVPARERTALGLGAAQALARQNVAQVLIITEGGSPIGLIFEGAALGTTSAEPPDNSVEPAGDITRPPTAAPFEAWPGLDAPERIQPLADFTVTVGLRAERDAVLTAVRAITVNSYTADDLFTVTLLADGADVLDGAGQRELPLKLGAEVTFACRARPGVSEVVLTAEFVCQWQVAGTATRRVAVSADPASAPPPSAPSDPCRMGVPAREAQTDLVLTITRSRAEPGQLMWTLLAPNPPINVGPLVTQLSDAREFAAQIIQELRTQQYRGPFAAQILENKGQDIADIMPAEFFDVLRQVHAAVQRPPTLLLLTDETYVPWELALIDPPLDPARPAYLGAQTVMGRWLRHEKVQSPPPWALSIDHLTAVAAGYGLGTNLPQLAFALDEQTFLGNTYQARLMGATSTGLLPLVTEPRRPGHLIHFAVHGLSDPAGNDQALLLSDDTRLPPSALAGRFRCGQVPNFSFVFLNACQVGTAGGSLGQAAGFPGDLIRGGVQGFLAPLWNVDDADARQFAERFYTAALDQHTPVGEVLLAERQTYTPAGTTTPMAYIFYGHPLLKLERAS